MVRRAVGQERDGRALSREHHPFFGDEVSQFAAPLPTASTSAGSSDHVRYIEPCKKLQNLAERRDRAAILAMVTPDLEYHYHVGSKPVTGPKRLGRFLDNYWGRSKDGVWKIETFAQSGDTLLMEGWEEYGHDQRPPCHEPLHGRDGVPRRQDRALAGLLPVEPAARGLS